MVDVDVRRAQRLAGKRRTLLSSTVKAHLRVLCAVGWVYQHWPVRGVPAFVTLKDGTIVAVRSDEPQTSTNGGRTWDVPRRFCVHSQMEIVSIIRLNSGRLDGVVSRVEGIPNLGHDKTLFRPHVPPVGLLDPGSITEHLAICPFVGEIPADFAPADSPNIHFHLNTTLFHYDHNPKFGPDAGAYWTLRIFPIEELHSESTIKW